MSNYITLNRKKHISVLADHRIDPVTKELLKVGDEVCACAECKTIYSRKVWDSVKRKTCCDQNKTLAEIPNTEYIDFEKKTDEQVKKSDYGCAFAFFLITTIGLGIATWYYYTSYEEKRSLNEILYRSNNSLQKEKKYVERKLNEVSNFDFRVGKKNAKGDGGYANTWFMFFSNKTPIILKHLYVQPKKVGYITIKLYDLNKNLIESKRQYLSYPESFNKVDLNFKILKAGTYYLSYDGKMSLWYNHSNNEAYKQYNDDVLKITGCNSNKRNVNRREHYLYFYDLNYSLLF